MRSIARWLLPCFVLAACGSPSPVGVYDLDKASLAATVQKTLNGPMPGLMQKMLEGASGTIELGADGKASMTMAMGLKQTVTGTWERDAQGVVMNVQDDQGKQDRITCGFNGRQLSILQELPTGTKLELLWNRREAR